MRLTIYAVTGQQIATVVSGYQEAEHYEVMWDGEGLGNGIYLYRLEATGAVRTKRMVYLE